MNPVSELGWKYEARIKSNPLLDGKQIRIKRFGEAKGTLKQVNVEMLIIKEWKRYWVRNELELKPAQNKREVEDLKQKAGNIETRMRACEKHVVITEALKGRG